MPEPSAVARIGEGLPTPPAQHHGCPYMDADLPPHKHAEHHALLEEFGPLLRDFLEAEKRRRDRWQFIQKTALGGFVLSCIGGMLTALAWLGGFALEAFRHWLNTGARAP